MANNALLTSLGAWALTYLAHSTLLLVSAWLMCRTMATRSHALRERVWKFAAVAGVVTAGLAIFGGWGLSYSYSFSSARTASSVLTTESLTTKPVGASVISGPPVRHSGTPEQGRAEAATRLPRDSSRPARFPANSTSTGLRSSVDDSEQAWSPALDITVEEYAALEALLLADEQNLAQPTDAVSVPAVAPVAKATKFPAEPWPAPPRATAPGKPNERESRSLWQRFQASAPAFAGLAIAVWMGLGLLRLLWRELTLMMALRSCRPVTDGPACQLFDAVQRQAGLGRIRFSRRPRLLASSDMTEPMACGVWSPCIVLPSGCDQRLSRDELRALLAHELAHLLRGDAVWLWAGRVLCSSLSFQPLNFVARRAWQAAAEIQCDDWAVEHSVSVVSLASCLTQVAEWKLDRRAAEALTATSTGGPLTQRIERLLGDRPVDLWKSRWRSRFSLLAGFVLGIGFAWVAPKVDHTLRAQTEAVSDLAKRQQLWDEISSDLSAAQADLERLAGKPEATGDDPMRSKVEALRERARRLR